MIDINDINTNFEDNSNIVFIDSNLDNYQTLIPGVSNTQVILLDSSRNGVEQITDILSNYNELDSIHILSHGKAGSLQLGSTNLHTSNLSSYSEDLSSWSNSLKENGDILFYGCNLAAGQTGIDFINNFSELTNADIAASDDLTGNSQLGGDWDLEVTTGNIEATITVNQSTQGSYQGLLNLLTNGSFEANAVDNDLWTTVDASAVAGWQSLNGERIELWDSGHNGVLSSNGSNHLELDYQGGTVLDGIYQDIQTQLGQTYKLSFDVRSRGANFNSDDEAVVVEWNGQTLKADGFKASGQGLWTTITTEVVGTGGTDRLLMRESGTPGASNGLGPLLDNVSLRVSNLLVNGSFEANNVDNNQWSTWDAAQVPGWQSLNGERLEIWDSGHNGVLSSNGSNHLELDYQAGSVLEGIYQDIQTQAGQTYSLKFDLRSRGANFNSGDETVVVEWNGQKLKADGFNPHSAPKLSQKGFH